MKVKLNKQQHLLVKLAEECNEVGKAALKAALFGLEDGYPGTTRTNKADIGRELNDLFAAVEMLHKDIKWRVDSSAVKLKKAKVEHWMEYAKKQGTLEA